MPDFLDLERTLSNRIKPTTRRRRFNKISKLPVSKYINNFRKSFNKTFGRIPIVQERQVHTVSPLRERNNPIYGRGLKKNKTRKHR